MVYFNPLAAAAAKTTDTMPVPPMVTPKPITSVPAKPATSKAAPPPKVVPKPMMPPAQQGVAARVWSSISNFFTTTIPNAGRSLVGHVKAHPRIYGAIAILTVVGIVAFAIYCCGKKAGKAGVSEANL
ncbi:MAG: hypothetical protein KGJ02_06655 [Verrucomicrobiota bacterium]|nr:hypothetical protein [Verrucomicrobiota bacterium]